MVETVVDKVGTVVTEAGGTMAGKQVGGIDGRDDNNLAREWHYRRYYFTYECHLADSFSSYDPVMKPLSRNSYSWLVTRTKMSKTMPYITDSP